MSESRRKLTDVAEIVMGQSPAGETCNRDGIGFPLLNGPTEFGPNHPSPTQYTTAAKRFSQDGDLLFCVRGSTTGRMNWSDQVYAIGRGIAVIRHKSNPYLQSLVRAAIEDDLPKLLLSATGSTFPNVSANQLAEVSFPNLALEEEIAIANVLSALDDKIGLNRRMNETLEGMAQAIFRDWFVDFGPTHRKQSGTTGPIKILGGLIQDPTKAKQIAALFPNSFGDDGLPMGWEYSELSHFITIKHGYAFKGEFFQTDETPYILLTPGNFRIGGGFKSDKFKYYDGPLPNEYCLKKNELVLTMTDLSKAGDTLGYPAFVPEGGKSFFLHNQRIGRVIIRSKEVGANYLYQVFCSHAYRSHVLGGVTGSTVKHTSPTKISSFVVSVCSIDIMDFFEAYLSILRDRISLNDQENKTLAQTRDYLLPKLMSGTVRVGEAKEQVGTS